MTGELVHIASKEKKAPEVVVSTEHVPLLSITDWKVKWPLHFAFCYICFSPLHNATSEEQ